MKDGKPVYHLAVTESDVSTWIEHFGHDSVKEWCKAHGWDPNEICRGSVIVWVYEDSTAMVSASRILKDEKGRPYKLPDLWEIATEDVIEDYVASIPEGIGTIFR